MDAQLVKKLKLNSFRKKGMIKSAKEKETAFAGYDFSHYESGQLDLAIAYVYSLEEMRDVIFSLIEQQTLEEMGVIYLIYPKNNNRLGHSPIHRDAIFPYLQVDEETGYINNTDFKFNRMVALDENYTIVAVKFFPKRKVRKNTSVSGRTKDYVERVADLQHYLRAFPDQAAFYNSLTPGYQKDWARYVYSAKMEQTIQKRLEEMVDILEKGYKTKQLYRESLSSPD